MLSHVSCYPLTLRFPCKPPILYFKGLVCVHWSFSGGSSGKPSCQCRRHKFDPWVRKIPWRRKWQPTPVFLPGKSHRQRSLVGYTVHGVTRFRHNLVTEQLHKTKIFNASKIVYYLYMLVIGVNIVYFS